MKKTAVVLLVFILQMFFVRSAMADKNSASLSETAKVRDKPKDHKAWYFVASPAYYLTVHMTIHEGSHALAIGFNPNYTVSNFKPYPHLVDGGPHFLLGNVDVVCVSKMCDDKIGMGLISVAPYITDTVLFTTSDLLLSTKVVKPNSVSGRVLYFAGMVVPWWDFSYNAIWAIKGSDAYHVAKDFEIPRWSVMAAGMSVSAVGIWRLWTGYKRAFPSQSRGRAKESNLVVVPMGSSGTVGISASMRF